MVADWDGAGLPRPDVVLGQHVMVGAAGTVTYRPGVILSAGDSLQVRMFGRGAHGSQPQLSVDPVPSTDAALANLPMEQSGSGAGIYKMASSLGAALGVAVSGAIFTALGSGSGIRWLEGVITFQGRVDNLALRERPRWWRWASTC